MNGASGFGPARRSRFAGRLRAVVHDQLRLLPLIAELRTVARPPPTTAAASPTLIAFHELLAQRMPTATIMLSTSEMPNWGAALAAVARAWVCEPWLTISM